MSSEGGPPPSPGLHLHPWAPDENNQDWYRDLVEHSHDLLCVHDLQGRLLAVNPLPARLLGYSVEEILQVPMRGLIAPEFRDQFDAYLKQIERVGEAHGLMAVVGRSGERRIWEYHNTLRTAGVTAPVVRGIAHDVTEQRRADAMFRGLLEAAPDAMVVVNAEGRIVLVNAQVERIFGYPRAELLGHSIEMLVPERLRERHLQLRNEFLCAPAEMPMGRVGEFFGLHKNGHEFPIEINLSPMKTAEGLLVTSAIRDITERKRTQEQILESQAELQNSRANIAALFESVTDMIWSVDRQYRLLTYNTALAENFRKNYRTEARVGAGPDDLLPPERAARWPPLYERVFAEGAFSQEYSLLDGRILDIALYPILRDGEAVGVSAFGKDITERKRAEEKLRASEERLRLAQEVAKMGTFERNLHVGESRWSSEMEQIYGLPPGGFPRTIQAFLDLIHPADRTCVAHLVDQSLQTGFAGGEWRVTWPDGTVHWIAGRWRVFHDEHGQPVRAIGMDFDITELKQAEEALRTSEERLRVALKNAPITVFHQDCELRYTWANNLSPAWAEADILGKTDVEIFEPETSARMIGLKREVLENGEGKREMLTVSHHGEVSYFDVTVEPLRDSSGRIVGVNSACMDVTHLEQITEELRHAKEKLAEEKLYLEQEIDTELGFEEIVGKSLALKDVMEKIGKVATSDATVLLLGETGTGKELVARALHRLSRRAGNSFIKMNCAAIPSGLLESELFGHEKGAFTGAISKKLGRLELADKGTLFLDEIGEIPLALQPKLLRVLQDQEFERLGGTQTLKVDFRLIAATNRDLAKSVTKNEFRSDLYYRLNVFPVRVPPLRDRPEDIRLLVEHFVQKCAKRMNKKITSIPKRTMDALTRWDWPGNVRELENFVERSVILTHGSVLLAPLSELRPASDDANETLEAAERELILRALRESHGQVGGPRGAAARLGLKRTTLQSKLKQMGIDRRPAAPGH